MTQIKSELTDIVIMLLDMFGFHFFVRIEIHIICANLKLFCVLQAAGVGSVIGAGAVGLGVALQASVLAGDLELHPPKYPWTHSGMFDALDHSG